MGLAALDLNILVTLQALLEERNVTRAGERIQLSQPATSAALAKLRRHFNDDLLVRVGREYQLTPLAQTLLPLVSDALARVERTFSVRSEFDAVHSQRRFRITSSDYVASVVNPPLRRLVASEAPGLAVEFYSLGQFQEDELLRYDLMIGPVGYGLAVPHEPVFRDHYVAVIDPGHVALAPGDEPDVLALLHALPHAVGRFRNNVTVGDRLLEDLGIERTVAVTVGGFVPLPFLVQGTDLIAVLPSRVARPFADQGLLRILQIPGSERLPLVENTYWHPSRTEDPAVQWLRTAVLRACELLPAL